jgi:endonuclease YncB( thermonuclease family)
MRVLPGLIAFALQASAAGLCAEPQTGRVTHVVDGDTLEVLLSRKRIRVALAEIDAPEQAQAYGLRSRQSLLAICGGEIATIETGATDASGRTRAQVTCNGTDASAEQVRLGMAWVSPHDSRAGSTIHALQEEAKATRRGLWADLAPVPPWEWRRRLSKK